MKVHKVVRDYKTGYNFGFGFVDYVDPVHAVQAIQKFNGLKLLNKVIKVWNIQFKTLLTLDCIM